MGYHLEGRLLEVCDCNIPYPVGSARTLTMAPARPPKPIASIGGQIEGVDVAGLTVAEMDDIPGNILQGHIRGVFFIDDHATPEQERMLRQA